MQSTDHGASLGLSSMHLGEQDIERYFKLGTLWDPGIYTLERIEASEGCRPARYLDIISSRAVLGTHGADGLQGGSGSAIDDHRALRPSEMAEA
jgi:hypothetical protein